MNIKVLHIINVGTVIADVISFNDDTRVYTIKNPVAVNFEPQGIRAVPLLLLQEEDSVEIREDLLIFKTLSDPILEMRNQYNQMFGAGIVEAKNIPKIHL